MPGQQGCSGVTSLSNSFHHKIHFILWGMEAGGLVLPPLGKCRDEGSTLVTVLSKFAKQVRETIAFLACAVQNTLHVSSHLILYQPNEMGTAISPFRRWKYFSFEKLKHLPNKAGHWQGWYSKPHSLTLELICLAYMTLKQQ